MIERILRWWRYREALRVLRGRARVHSEYAQQMTNPYERERETYLARRQGRRLATWRDTLDEWDEWWTWQQLIEEAPELWRQMLGDDEDDGMEYA